MRIPIAFMLTLVIAAAGCSTDSYTEGEGASAPAKATQAPLASQRGGTITVGEDSWTIIPSTQCSIYPGNVVSIARHAAEDRSLEIVIDYGGPKGARIGDGGSTVSWHALRATLQIKIDGPRVQGTATFSQFAAGTGAANQASFDVTC